MIKDKVMCPSCEEYMDISVEHEDSGEGPEHCRTCRMCGHLFKFYINYEPVESLAMKRIKPFPAKVLAEFKKHGQHPLCLLELYGRKAH